MEMESVIDEKTFGHCIVDWTIQNFCVRTCEEDYSIRSPSFSVKGPVLTRWKIILNSTTNNDHILLYLYRKKSKINSNNVLANWKFCFMINENPFVVEERTSMFAVHTMYEVDMHKLEVVLEHIKPFEVDELKIQCQLLITYEASFTEKNLVIDEGLRSLSENLRVLYTKQFNCDIIFKFGDDYINAHKAILYFRNRKLAEIIDEHQEKDFIDLPHVDHETMDKIFFYLYSGNMSSLLEKPSISLYEGILFLGIDEVLRHYTPEHTKLYSDIDVQEIFHFWTIADFSETKEYQSPDLSIGTSSTVWRLHLYSVGRNKYIAITAEPVKRFAPHSVCLEFGVVNTKHEYLLVKRFRKYMEKKVIVGSNYFIKMGNEDTKHLFEDNVLHIEVKIRMATGIVNASNVGLGIIYTMPSKHNSYELLSKDMEQMRTSQKFCDTTLKMKEASFEAHTCVLFARSSTLADFFEMYADTSVIEISDALIDIPSNVMDIVLHYIYCGTLGDLEVNYQDLYRAADLLEISSLNAICSRALQI